MAGALIVTAELGAQDFAWINGLRRRHYPPERNRVPAHLTMFRALPPSAESEVRSALARLATEAPPVASIEGLMDLGGGAAFRIVSPGLDRIRSDLAEDFHGLLGAQDSGGWRPHITIQNKVPPRIARALIEELSADFRPRPLAIASLALHRYLDGPWLQLARYPFRG
jgi:hypothetical protein